MKAKTTEKAPRKAPQAKRAARGAAKAAGDGQAPPAVETAAQRRAREAREVAAFMAAHPERRAKPRAVKPEPEPVPEATKPTTTKVRTDAAPWARHAKAGDVMAAHRAYEGTPEAKGTPEVKGWKKENAIPAGVDPLAMLPRAALAVARSAHQREKAKPLLAELRRRLAAALDTSRALARELAWPMPWPMPKVLENVEIGEPSAWALAKAAHLPDTAEIVDFLGRAIRSADGAIAKMPKGGPKHSVLGVLGNGLADAKVDDGAAVDFLRAVKLEKDGPRAPAIGRQQKRGTGKR